MKITRVVWALDLGSPFTFRKDELRRIHLLSTRVKRALSPWVALTSAGKGTHMSEQARKIRHKAMPEWAKGALLQQRDAHIVGYYTEGRLSPNWGVLRALGWGRAR